MKRFTLLSSTRAGGGVKKREKGRQTLRGSVHTEKLRSHFTSTGKKGEKERTKETFVDGMIISKISPALTR